MLVSYEEKPKDEEQNLKESVIGIVFMTHGKCKTYSNQ